MSDLVEKITRAISPREEPRMWEYYRVERTLESAAIFVAGAGVFLLVWWLL